MIQKIVFNRN